MGFLRHRNRASVRFPFFFLFLLLFLVFLSAFSGKEAAAASEDTTDIEIIGTFGQTEARSMLDLINDFRHSDDAWYWNEADTEKVVCSGLNDFVYDYELEAIAMQRAAEIAVFYSHTRPDGSDCFTLQYGQMAVGENIAAGSGSALDTAEEAFMLWREDKYSYSGQGHRRNMLDNTLTHIGIGHFSYNDMHFWVQEFSCPGYGAEETESYDLDAEITIPVRSSYIRGLGIALSETSFFLKAGTVSDLPVIVPWTATSSDWPSGNNGMPVYNASISIESSDENIAWVCDGQICTGDTDGTATFTVTATLGNFTATKTFSVTVYTTLSLENAEIKLSTVRREYTGEAFYPAVTVTYEGAVLTEGTDYTVTYDEDMINCGAKNITVTGIGEYSGSINKTFTINKVSYIGHVTFRYGSIIVGQTEEIYHTEDSEPYLESADITYESEDTSIATVDENGMVTGVGEGMTNIVITFHETENFLETVVPLQYYVARIDVGIHATIIVKNPSLTYTGSELRSEITVKSGTETLVEGTDYFLTYPEDCVNAGTKAILITGINRCKGTKTVTYEIAKARSVITLTDTASPHIKVGETVDLGASAPTKITYTPDDPFIVSISSGLATGLSSGQTMITMTSDSSDNYYGSTNYITIYVSKQPDIAATGITLDKSALTLAVGESAALSAVIIPSDATDNTISWTSSNSSVAEVDKTGKVTAKKYGKATITAATSNGKTAACTVQTLFKDVADPDRSYFNAVYWAVDNKITKCTTSFKPDAGVTRGEFTAFLYRLAGSPTVSSSMKKAVKFTDVNSGTKFYKEICWAVNKGIIKGFSDKTFRPDDGLTRSQCAIMIWRYAGRPSVSVKTSPFPDVKAANTDSCRAIIWGSQKGIIKGLKGYFMPADPCTRAHVVTFLYRYVNL